MAFAAEFLPPKERMANRHAMAMKVKCPFLLCEVTKWCPENYHAYNPLWECSLAHATDEGDGLSH